MTALSIVLDIVLILISLVLIAAVLMQQGQRQGLGAIAGGADTFFGKNKAKGLDGKLQKITKIAAVVFIVLAIVTTIVVAHNSKASTPTLDDVVNGITATDVATDAAEADAEADAADAEGEEPATEPEAEAEDPAAEPAEDAKAE